MHDNIYIIKKKVATITIGKCDGYIVYNKIPNWYIHKFINRIITTVEYTVTSINSLTPRGDGDVCVTNLFITMDHMISGSKVAMVLQSTDVDYVYKEKNFKDFLKHMIKLEVDNTGSNY